MHLLVVEDEHVMCDTIVRSLRRSAYSVDYCYDGDEALELLAVERYDLVLLDLNLPGKDGMTVLRTFRQTDQETPVLILSARGEVEDKVEGLDAGANDYLAKPFHLAELEALKEIFVKKIIPLLQEYFYDDYAKIDAVLNGNKMIEITEVKVSSLFSKKDKDLELDDKKIYKITPFENEIWDNSQTYKNIYVGKESNSQEISENEQE